MSHCPQHIYTLISSLPTLIQPAEQDIVNKGKIIDEYIVRCRRFSEISDLGIHQSSSFIPQAQPQFRDSHQFFSSATQIFSLLKLFHFSGSSDILSLLGQFQVLFSQHAKRREKPEMNPLSVSLTIIDYLALGNRRDLVSFLESLPISELTSSLNHEQLYRLFAQFTAAIRSLSQKDTTNQPSHQASPQPLSKDQSIIESEDILDNLRKNAEGDDKEFVDVMLGIVEILKTDHLKQKVSFPPAVSQKCSSWIDFGTLHLSLSQRQAVNSRNQATFFSTVYSHFPQSSEGDILLNCITNNVADLVEALQRHPDPSYTILAIPIAVLLSPPTQQVQNSVNVLPRLSSLLPRPSLRLHVIQLLLTLTQSLPPPASPMFTEYLHAYLTNLLGFSDSHFIETHHSLVPVLQLQHLQNTRLSKGLQTSAELCSSFAFTSTLHTLFNIVPPAKIFSHAFLTSYVTSLCTLCMQQYLQSVNSRTISPFTEADSFIQTMLSVFASSSSPDSPQPILPSSFALLKTIRQYHLCLKNATTSLPHVSSGDRSLVTLIFPQTHLYEQQPFDMATTYLTHLLSTPHSLLSPQILLLFHNFADALNKPKDNIPFITASSLRQLTSLWQLFLSNKTNSFAPEDQTAIGHIRAVLLESLPRSLSISR